jgi:hypothetical protein
VCSDSDSAVIGKWRRRMGSAIDELLPRARRHRHQRDHDQHYGLHAVVAEGEKVDSWSAGRLRGRGCRGCCRFHTLADLADMTFRRLVTGCLMIKIVTGVLLVVLAFRQWRKRPANADQAELPKWMARVDTVLDQGGSRVSWDPGKSSSLSPA